MSVSIITHKGREIVYADYTACQSQEDIIEVAKRCEAAMIDKQNVRCLHNFIDVTVTTKALNYGKEAANNTWNDRVTRGAFLGVTGIKKILLQGFNLVSKIKWIPFETETEALDYLAED